MIVGLPYCSACGAKLQGRPPATCPACGTAHWVNAKPGAEVLTTRVGQLLLLRRANEPWLGRWDIPVKFREPDEHPMETAAREAREECGLEVEITGFLGLWLDRYPDPADPGRPNVTLNAYYHARAGNEVGAPDPHETSEVGWFEPQRPPARDRLPAPRRSGPRRLARRGEERPDGDAPPRPSLTGGLQAAAPGAADEVDNAGGDERGSDDPAPVAEQKT